MHGSFQLIGIPSFQDTHLSYIAANIAKKKKKKKVKSIETTVAPNVKALELLF